MCENCAELVEVLNESKKRQMILSTMLDVSIAVRWSLLA